MKKPLQKIIFILAGLSVPLGFLAGHPSVSFWWHRIPFLDAMVGGVGALLLLGAKEGIASIASKQEDFYD